MSLRHSYTFIAPFYDFVVQGAMHRARIRSMAPLVELPAGEVLLAGVGTGLDLPLLPARHRYTGIDLTRAMLDRALARRHGVDFVAVQGDAQRLPFGASRFDAVVLHLILAVVPEPRHCLAESARVLKPGGEMMVFDKFLRPGQTAPLRRALNVVARRVASRLDVVFEELVGVAPDLSVIRDEPAMGDGWFRLIVLRKAAAGRAGVVG
jgi:ubiquinone/menaquinone biosynthesis C-methylase UbiE